MQANQVRNKLTKDSHPSDWRAAHKKLHPSDCRNRMFMTFVVSWCKQDFDVAYLLWFHTGFYDFCCSFQISALGFYNTLFLFITEILRKSPRFGLTSEIKKEKKSLRRTLQEKYLFCSHSAADESRASDSTMLPNFATPLLLKAVNCVILIHSAKSLWWNSA